MNEALSLEDGGRRGDAQRDRILEAAAGLIAEGGLEAATTRAVAEAASVQAPAIYRLFGDKRGLLDAVAQKTLTDYIASKALTTPHPDPVQDLIDGWDAHLAFALANPELFTLMSVEPNRTGYSAAAAAGLDVLRQRVRRVALTGRLRVSEGRAVGLMHASFVGVALTLLDEPAESRDPGLSATTRDAVMQVLLGDATVPSTAGPTGAAAALRAALPDIATLTVSERHLMGEWLDRIVNGN